MVTVQTRGKFLKMSQAIRKEQRSSVSIPPLVASRIKEGFLITLVGLSIFLMLSLISHHPADQGWSNVDSTGHAVHNLAGFVGAWFSDLTTHLFGYFSFLIPVFVAALGWGIYRDKINHIIENKFLLGLKFVGLIAFTCNGCALLWIRAGGVLAHPGINSGGILGNLFGSSVLSSFGDIGGTILMLAGFFAGFTFLTGWSWLKIMDKLGAFLIVASRKLLQTVRNLAISCVEKLLAMKAKRVNHPVANNFSQTSAIKLRLPKNRDIEIVKEPILSSVEIDGQIACNKETLPNLDLLDNPEVTGNSYSDYALNLLSKKVEEKLLDFGIEVKVVSVKPGPVVTRFELQPEAGLKASRITNLSKDLARSLSAISVRVVEVIPGKTCVGLEIPNESREMVYLKEILNSSPFHSIDSSLPIALGKDISGNPVAADLARMPHLLVAGTTGSGKSVALNAMILSLLYKSTPDNVRFIMIDPKMLELSVYDDIPNLLSPVVTDMKDAANALRWCVAEMERRYKLMSHFGVRNLDGFNKLVADSIKKGEPLLVPSQSQDKELTEEVLYEEPRIVLIIDELADLMMVVGKKVEDLIARLAQKARASGIHLILATQRPSVDVITGLIKANIPSRISFQVSSKVDSRTILDQVGAENLLGHGDMLYLPPGAGLPNRIHGAFVSDDEVHKVVKRLKEIGEPNYNENVLAGHSELETGLPGYDSSEDLEQDELYDRAVSIVLQTKKASVSGIQRRLKIGYNRAARMVEAMESAGIVGELQANGAREILVPTNVSDS